MVPERLADLLQWVESEFGFDLIPDGLEPADMGDLLRGQLETSQAEAKAEQNAMVLAQEAARTETAAEQQDACKSFIQEQIASSKTNADIILALAHDPRIPEVERVKLVQFAAIVEIAQAAPADAGIILARVEAVDLSGCAPDPKRFARAFIFDAPDSALPSGVSETTQDVVAEVPGIERPDMDVVTGSGMIGVFENGIGTRTVRDPETGELRKEPIILEPAQFEEIRDDPSIGLTDTGVRVMRFDEEVGEFTVLMPDAIFLGRNFMAAGRPHAGGYRLALPEMSCVHDQPFLQQSRQTMKRSRFSEEQIIYRLTGLCVA